VSLQRGSWENEVGADVVGDALGALVVGDVLGDAVVGVAVVGAAVVPPVGAKVGDAVGDSVHGSEVHTSTLLYEQPVPTHERSHITRPSASHSASACVNVCSRGGMPAMHPSLLLEDT
jgi:hypothetical protein